MTRIRKVDLSDVKIFPHPVIDEYWRKMSIRAKTMGLICIERDCKNPALFMEMGDSQFFFCFEHAKHVLTYGNRDIHFKPPQESYRENMTHTYILFQIGDVDLKPIATVTELESRS